MKKVIIINQNKGGVGKSFLTALILEKEKQANTNFSIMDIDSGNRSTFKRFSENEGYAAYVTEFSLLKGDTIDKGLFSIFFESLNNSTKDIFYLDLGGNESREILSLFKTVGVESVAEFFKATGIDVEFMTVVKVGDRDCLDHLYNVTTTLGKNIKHTCMANSNSFENESVAFFKSLENYCKKSGITLKTFGKCPAGHIETTISEYVRSGFKSSLGMFRGIFVGMVENLNLA